MKNFRKSSKALLVIFYFLLFTFNSKAQNVGINTTGATPNAKALLDIDASGSIVKGGLLIPRLTTTERNAITAPIPMSLLIFNTTTECFEAWNQTTTTWVPFGCIGCYVPTGVTAMASPNPICVGSNLTLTGAATNATSWSWSGPNSFTSALQSPTITGVTTAAAGVYTLTASNACGAAAAVNTITVTVNTAPVAAAGADQTLVCGSTTATLAGNTPSAGSGLWAVVSGTATITTPSSPTSGITGLVAGSVTLTWTITNSPCAPSIDTVVITSPACPSYCIATASTALVPVFSPATGRTWMDRNLGASRAAIASYDEQASGCTYQWGRGADGHEIRNSPMTSVFSSTDSPGNNSFIINPTYINNLDWRNPQNDNLWQGVAGINNPCPTNYRLPTSAELSAEAISWSTSDAAGAFASPLKLPVNGIRRLDDGFAYHGSGGNYATSTVFGTNTMFLFINTGVASMNNNGQRGMGYGVRCIRNF